MKSIEKIQKLIRQELGEAMYIDGGINEPSAPEGVPHRMPAAQAPKDDERKDVDDKYDLAFKAREATENLVKHLDTSIYDDAYESAYKATMALRDVLNTLIELGASAENEKAVVAPPEIDQKYDGGRGDFTLNPLTTGGFSANMVEGELRLPGAGEKPIPDMPEGDAGLRWLVRTRNEIGDDSERLELLDQIWKGQQNVQGTEYPILSDPDIDKFRSELSLDPVQHDDPGPPTQGPKSESKRYLKKLIQAELAKLS